MEAKTETSHGALSAEIVRLREDRAALLAACKLALTENHCTPDTDKILYAAIERAERP